MRASNVPRHAGTSGAMARCVALARDGVVAGVVALLTGFAAAVVANCYSASSLGLLRERLRRT